MAPVDAFVTGEAAGAGADTGLGLDCDVAPEEAMSVDLCGRAGRH